MRPSDCPEVNDYYFGEKGVTGETADGGGCVPRAYSPVSGRAAGWNTNHCSMCGSRIRMIS